MKTRWEINLQPARPHKIMKDGVDITNEITSISIHASAGEVTSVQVEYINLEVVGEVEVDPTDQQVDRFDQGVEEGL